MFCKTALFCIMFPLADFSLQAEQMDVVSLFNNFTKIADVLPPSYIHTDGDGVRSGARIWPNDGYVKKSMKNLRNSQEFLIRSYCKG